MIPVADEVSRIYAYQFCTTDLCSLRKAIAKGFNMITAIQLYTNEVLKFTLKYDKIKQWL